MVRKFAWLAVAIVLLLAVVMAGALVYVRSSRPPVDGGVTLAGLGHPVEAFRDSMGVPHLFAEDETDLLFAQGYTQAQDRLWQMELFSRVAQGRLSEVLGAGLVDTDRFLRTIGIWRAAAAQEVALDSTTLGGLKAYAAGVNAWIDGHHGALPPEFLALRFEPGEWTPRHSLAIEKIMAWDLASYDNGVQLSGAVRAVGAGRAAILQESDPPEGTTILESDAIPPPVPATAAALLDASSITRASNAWVIGGALTRSGKPILANDMHLALRAPSLWYLMALHAPGYEVAGMTLPGVPFVVAGHSRAIAWGFTNAMLDDVDLFVERPDPADASRYLTPDGSAPFETRTDTIRLRGRDEPVVVEIRSTRHGPVLENVRSVGGSDVVAMRWAAHDPSTSLTAIPAMGRARDANEFVAAIAEFDNPHQNVVYADTAGGFGYAMAGRIPIRGTGRRPPVLPVPGWTGEWDWAGYAPFSAHPQVFAPSQGYVVTANNRQVAGAAADGISAEWEMPFRAERIRQMVRAGGPFSAADVAAMQLDVRDLLAERYRDVAVRAAERAGQHGAASELRSWNLEASENARGAALFNVWYERLRIQVQRAFYGGRPLWFPRRALNLVLDSAALPWLANGDVTLDSLASRALVEADSIVAGRTWGEVHTIGAEHALAASALLNRLLGLNIGPEPAAGSPVTVNVAHYGGGAVPLRSTYGPSQRHVADLADIDGAGGFILPTGQSGLPFDEHYDDQWPLWRRGGLWRVPLDRAAAQARAVHRLVLRPAGD